MTLAEIYRAIAQFHENEKLVTWLKQRWIIGWLTPEHRRRILICGSTLAGIVGVFHRHAPWREYGAPSTWLAPVFAVIILFALVNFLYLGAARFSDLPAAVRRRPQIALHALFWLIIIVTWLLPEGIGLGRTVIVLVAISLPYILWRCGYMLLSAKRGKVAGTNLGDHIFYIWPTWGGTNTPIGKGADYLSQCEARSSDAYARAVLSGIKLLILSRLWGLARLVIAALVYANPKSPFTPLFGDFTLAIPRIQNLASGNASASLLTTWVSLYMELVWETLEVAEDGHLWVGMLRLFGFNVFRNTYKPLLAKSLIDFWNRYHYYFKELMLEFFFFPTYARRWQKSPRLRIFAAVFAAAFFGNMYHHLLKAKNLLVAGDLIDLWFMLNPRLVYCFLLALGIYVSMLREQKTRARPAAKTQRLSPLRSFTKIAGVWTFYSIIHIWNLKGAMTIAARMDFALALFGL